MKDVYVYVICEKNTWYETVAIIAIMLQKSLYKDGHGPSYWWSTDSETHISSQHHSTPPPPGYNKQTTVSWETWINKTDLFLIW